MSQCVSIKADGARCTNNGNRTHDDMCGTHHNQKMRNDPAYAARFVPAPVLHRFDAVIDGVIPHPPRVIHMRLPRPGQPHPIVNQALRRFNAMRTDILNLRDDLQILMNMNRADMGPNPIFNNLEAMFAQLVDIHRRIEPLRDTINNELETQLRTELQAVRQYENHARAAAAPALRRFRENALANMFAQFIDDNVFGQDNAQPIVIARDPEGSVNLRAFALDNQSVHRSSVQSMAQQGVEKILTFPAPPHNQETMFEITVAFTSQGITWQAPHTYESTIQELHRDYEIQEAFGVKYSRVLDYLWSYIKAHIERDEITRRLAEECSEGRGMCSNGKMARLINVLQGYDDTIAIQMAPSREQFQVKIAALASRPMDERRTAATVLFTEYNIPEVEYNAWLEPLLDS